MAVMVPILSTMTMTEYKMNLIGMTIMMDYLKAQLIGLKEQILRIIQKIDMYSQQQSILGHKRQSELVTE